MGSYTFSSYGAYLSSGAKYTSSPNSGTFSDGESDSTFEIGDTYTGNGPVGNTTYVYKGFVTIGPDSFPVFTAPAITGSSTYLILSSDRGQSWPASISGLPGNTSDPFCFAAGTWIATPDGDVVVEALSIGDLVHTSDGRAVPVKWIGWQTINKRFAGEKAQLVRIAAGVLGNHSDLYVTGDHGMVVDGLVINAGALVNGGSIDWVPLSETSDQFRVYHIETEAHDVILANGAPAETFVDVPGRMVFDNYAEYLALYGAERIIPEMPRPRISAQRLVPDAIKARLGISEPQFDLDIPLRA